MNASKSPIAAVIVAAGMSTRMKEFKQLMEIGGTTMAERVVMNFRKAGVRDIVMVTGYRAEELEKVLAKRDVTFLRNERYAESEMFDSVKIGLSYLADSAERFFFCPVDVPFFLDETLRRLMESDGEIVIPVREGRAGHPVLIDGALIPSIMAYEGDKGLKGALDTMDAKRVTIEVSDEGSFLDADTREDYEKLVELHNRHLMRAEIRVTLSGAKSFFGPGTMTLLRQIERTGNVREACEKTGISYSKGWNIIRSLESGLQLRLIDRIQGGKQGGSATLTAECKNWMRLYDALERDTAQFADTRYQELYQEIF